MVLKRLSSLQGLKIHDETYATLLTYECYLLLGDIELALGYTNKLSYLDEGMANDLLVRIFPGQDGSFTGNSRR